MVSLLNDRSNGNGNLINDGAVHFACDRHGTLARRIHGDRGIVTAREHFPIHRRTAVDLDGDGRAEVVIGAEVHYDDGGTPNDPTDDALVPLLTDLEATGPRKIDVRDVPPEVVNAVLVRNCEGC